MQHHLRKGFSESKHPHVPCSALYRNEVFLTQTALFWEGGKWGLFNSATLFFRSLGDFDPCKGQRDSYIRQARVFLSH